MTDPNVSPAALSPTKQALLKIRDLKQELDRVLKKIAK